MLGEYQHVPQTGTTDHGSHCSLFLGLYIWEVDMKSFNQEMLRLFACICGIALYGELGGAEGECGGLGGLGGLGVWGFGLGFVTRGKAGLLALLLLLSLSLFRVRVNNFFMTKKLVAWDLQGWPSSTACEGIFDRSYCSMMIDHCSTPSCAG